MTKEPTIDDDEAAQLLEETTVEMGGEDHSLGDVLKDIQAAHKELDDFKSGALSISKTLDERKMQAKQEGDDSLVTLLEDLKDSGFGVYLRLQRGDLELLGERDGKHSGYFADE